MDIFKFTKSKTKQKILQLFLTDPEQIYYLRDLERRLKISAGNIRRELSTLVQAGLFKKLHRGRLIYYQINLQSNLYKVLELLSHKNISLEKSIIEKGFLWVTKASSSAIPADIYCPTRDIFQVRLESYGKHLEATIGPDAYLIIAVAGEIGNNSFDHNLGQWKDLPGIFFAHDENKKTIVLADRGQGILRTINRVLPEVNNDKEALNIAFTKTISGRSPEKRGNGLKFVSQILKDKKWGLRFDSGQASLMIRKGQMRIIEQKRDIKGCFAVIYY